MKKIFFFIILIIGVFFIDKNASAIVNVYYSVGQNTFGLKTGSPTITIDANGVATFSVPQTAPNMGVGNQILYGTPTNYSTIYVSAKQSTSVWNVVTAKGALPPATTSVNVLMIRHTYSSLSAAEASWSDASHLATTSLRAAPFGCDTILNIPLYYDVSEDTSRVTISGTDTDSAHYIKIYTPTNTSTEVNRSQRHAGIWTSDAFNIGFSGDVITVSNNYVWLDGLQITAKSTSASSALFLDQGINSLFQISNSIIRNAAGASANSLKGINSPQLSFAANRIVKIWNTLVYGWWQNANSMCINMQRTDAFIYNATAFDCWHGVNRATQGNVYAKNVIVASSTLGFTGTFSAASTNNSSNLAGDAPGPNAKTGNPSFVDATNKNFHLQANDTIALNNGIDLSSDASGGQSFASDIENEARPQGLSWDIGADEYVYPPSSMTPPNLYLNYVISTGDVRAVSLGWTDADNEDYYRLYRSQDGNTWTDVSPSGLPIPGKNPPESVDSIDYTVTDGVNYFYKVLAFNATGQVSSNTLPVSVPVATPGAFVLSGQRRPTRVDLSWTASATTPNAGPITYSVWRDDTSDFINPTLICENVSALNCRDNNPSSSETFYKAAACAMGPQAFCDWSNVFQLSYSNIIRILDAIRWKEIIPW